MWNHPLSQWDVFQLPPDVSQYHSGDFLGQDTQSRDSIIKYTPSVPYIPGQSGRSKNIRPS